MYGIRLTKFLRSHIVVRPPIQEGVLRQAIAGHAASLSGLRSTEFSSTRNATWHRLRFGTDAKPCATVFNFCCREGELNRQSAKHRRILRERIQLRWGALNYAAVRPARVTGIFNYAQLRPSTPECARLRHLGAK